MKREYDLGMLAQAVYLTNDEGAAYLRLGAHSWYENIAHNPTVPRHRIGARVVYRREDLDHWMQGQMVSGEDTRAVLKGKGRGYKTRRGGAAQ